MKKTEFKIFKFNNKEYVLIDEYVFENKKIYFFLADEELFCTKENEKYNPILDKEKIKQIKEAFGLIEIPILFDRLLSFLKSDNIMAKIMRNLIIKTLNIKTYEDFDWVEISDDEKEKIIRESTEALEKLKDKGISPKDFYNRVHDVKIKTGDNKNFEYFKVLGSFVPKLNTVFFQEKFLKQDDVTAKRLKLHELLHKSSGAEFLKEYKYVRGLEEGMTENVVEKVYGEKKSKIITNSDGKKNIHFNFNDDNYSTLVSIVQQMEYLTGKDCSSDVVYGKDEMIKAFSEKYGENLITYIIGKTFLLTSKRTNDLYKRISIFEDLQNVILETTFNSEFEQIENIEDAKEYMKKLRGFEKIRGSIYIRNDNSFDFVEDSTFKDYYNLMHQEIKSKMLLKGYSAKQVSELDEYTYKRQEKYPMDSIEDLQKSSKDQLLGNIASKLAKGEEVDISNLRVEETYESNMIYLRIYDKDGEIVDKFFQASKERFLIKEQFEKIIKLKEELKTRPITRVYKLDDYDIETIMKYKKKIEDFAKEKEELKEIAKCETQTRIQGFVGRVRNFFVDLVKDNQARGED